jgi:hypothetical protein
VDLRLLDMGAGVTEDETAVVLALAEAWNLFLKLPAEHNDDTTEFRHAIHAAQDKVLARAARRELDPRFNERTEGSGMKPIPTDPIERMNYICSAYCRDLEDIASGLSSSFERADALREVNRQLGECSSSTGLAGPVGDPSPAVSALRAASLSQETTREGAAPNKAAPRSS